MRGLRLLYRLSLAFFVGLILFIAFFLLANQEHWVSDAGSQQLGVFGLLGFLALGLPLTALLAPRVQRRNPTWLFLLAYVGLAFAKAVGSWVLLAYLTYLGHQKLKA